MNTEEDLIIKLYSFGKRDQEVFPYARKYMKRISSQLPKIMQNSKRRERFMLVGLFITYRAFNHYGDSLTTDADTLATYDETDHISRLREFKRITGKSIEDTSHYLRMIRFNVFKIMLSYILGLDVILYLFVIYGW